MTEEVIVESVTGGKKGQKMARFDLIPPDAEWALAELYGRGAVKYGEHNWSKGYNWSLSYAALRRHLNQFWGGDLTDQETGCAHLACVMFHAMSLYCFSTRREYDQFDDRQRVDL